MGRQFIKKADGTCTLPPHQLRLVRLNTFKSYHKDGKGAERKRKQRLERKRQLASLFTSLTAVKSLDAEHSAGDTDSSVHTYEPPCAVASSSASASKAPSGSI